MYWAALHIILHFAAPFAVARLVFPAIWRRAYLVMVATLVVDLDHLLADPIYDPGRCSIGFHPLHQYPLIALYLALCFFPRLRLIGLGLVIHMILDGIDCF